MLLIRLILVLLVITAMVLLGMYLLFDDKKYLNYFKKTLKCTVYLALLVMVMFALRRLFYV
ncbi:MAG: hypothetical protein VW548_00055 [Methylotenera sp.]